MSILTELVTQNTGLRRFDTFKKPLLTLDCDETGNYRYHTIDANTEFLLKGTLCVPFWANSAQYNTARKAAVEVLVSRLYAEVFAILPELRLAISDGDREAALKLCGELEAEIRGPS